MIYEATISTVENSPQTAAWVLEPQLEQARPRDLAQPSPDGAQTLDASLTPSLRMGLGTPRRLGLGRAARLKQGRDFARVRQQGERLGSGCLIANWRRLRGKTESRLGVITAGKIGDAVVRNRARRLLRETFRLHQHDFEQAVELVLVARPSIVGKGFTEVERDFLTTLRRAGLLKGPSKS